MTKTVLITGATSAIGEATARRNSQKHLHRLIITGRGDRRLDELSAQLGSRIWTQKSFSLCFDVRVKE
ncbi:MAG: SDR family NAD(P)-dependent oxidoreductase [Bacteroidales bacterium]|nr:SDR family NAD(P)-dependent oxidoreductase [Bacteroidales bacterium]